MRRGAASGWRLRTRLQSLVAVLIALGVAGAISATLATAQVDQAENRLVHSLRMDQAQVASLLNAYVNEETGERGYLLTGDPSFLQPYTAGRHAAVRLQASLQHGLAGEPRAKAELAKVVHTGGQWLHQAAQPEIAARTNGQLHGGLPLPEALEAKQLFNGLRGDLSTLGRTVNALVATQLDDVTNSQNLARWVAVGTALAALGVAAVFFVVLRRSLTRPLDRLVAQVERASGGDIGRPLEVAGPPELAGVARAVDSMRARIVEETRERAEAEQRLAILEEDERIAGDLHDRVIQRLYGTALVMQTTGHRHPEVAGDIQTATGEIDEAIAELRAVIFGLTAHRIPPGVRERVLEISRAGPGQNGTPPAVRFNGPVDELARELVDEATLVLGELLSTVESRTGAPPVEITVGVDDRALRLEVSAENRLPDGAPLPEGGGLRLVDATERAARRGGSCAVRHNDGGGTSLEWTVPV